MLPDFDDELFFVVAEEFTFFLLTTPRAGKLEAQGSRLWLFYDNGEFTGPGGELTCCGKNSLRMHASRP